MKTRRFLVSIATLLSMAVCSAVSPQTGITQDGSQDQSSHQSVGLVLSGGGAKGIAHIGVIQALEDNDIPIDYITGTSMGSIVGGLYAAGYTPAEMMQLILSRDFSYWSTGRIDENLVYFFAKQDPTPVMVTVPINLTDSVSPTQLPRSLISPLPMSFAFMDLFAAYTAQCGGNFDNLFVPFRCVTSDVKNKHKIVLGSGSLANAVRASMSFPVVFQPIKMDGVLVYDGGIYDNFPVDVMRSEFAPSIMIGVDVHGTTDPAKADDLLNQLEDMIIQNNDYDLPADEGIKLRIDLNRFSLLDFPAAQAIYDIGYRHAMSMMDSIKGRVKSRIPAASRQLRRAVFKSGTPYVRFDSVTVSGGSERENEFIKYLFDKNSRDTFGLEDARLAFYRAITPGKLTELEPQAHFNPSTGLFKLSLQADVKNDLTAGVGGYLTSSVNSMAFLTARYRSMSLKTVDAAVDAWIGQSYMAAAGSTRLVLASHRPTALSLTGVVSRRKYYESDKVFFDDGIPTFITEYEAFGRLRYDIALGRKGKASLEVGGGTLRDKFYPSEVARFDDVRRAMTRFNLGQVRAQLRASTLDNITAPMAGYSVNAIAMWNGGHYNFTPGLPGISPNSRPTSWYQFDLQLSRYVPMSKHFSLGGSINAVYSDRSLLDTYNASIVSASGFTPTPASDNSFNPAFRANSYVALGLMPVWSVTSNLQVRGYAYLFQPFQAIERTASGGARYGDWFARRYAYTELAAAYTFRFATLSIYGNYQSYPARNWNAGISFGLYFLAPKFLR